MKAPEEASVNLEEPTLTLKNWIERHVAICRLCQDTLAEMETYVGTTGDWPEGTHGILENQIRALSRDINNLERQVELPL